MGGKRLFKNSYKITILEILMVVICSVSIGIFVYLFVEPYIISIFVFGSLTITILTMKRYITKPLHDALEKAETANKAKSNFLATMSHEIRTPMNAILGITQILMQNEELPKQYATEIEKIYASGNNLLGIINDILDLSKIETGKMELNLIEYDVPSLINDAASLNIVRIGQNR